MVCKKCLFSDDSFSRSYPCRQGGDHEWVDEPIIVRKKAIDVLPQIHGIWCSIGDGKPFVNTIELRNWSEDSREIRFMLGSFNFYFCEPDKDMNVVELPLSKYDNMQEILVKDAEFRKKKPMSDNEYSRVWAT